MTVDLWTGAPKPPRAWQREAGPIIVDALRARKRGIVSAFPGSGKSIMMAAIARLALAKAGGRAIVISAPKQKLVRQLHETLSEWCGGESVGMFFAQKKQPKKRIIVTCNQSLPALIIDLAAQGRQVALMISDECHSSESQTLLDAIPALAPVSLLGFTATPMRSIQKQTLSQWDEIIYRYTMADALRDGVLVPLRAVRVEGEVTGLVDEVCLDMMQAHAHGPGIVSSNGIEDAEQFAAWLTERQWPSKAIHSRHSHKEQEALLAGLRAGEFRALVHVSLLAEGVDLPWLRWICMRRKVGASVRFLQEICRPMRADLQDPTKTECVAMDPHLLLGRFGLSPSEAIGKALEEAADAEDREAPAVRPDQEMTEPEAVALDLLLSYLGEVHSQLRGSGIVATRELLAGTDGWRLAEVSAKQVDAIKTAGKLTRHIPADYREPIKALAKVPWALTRGQAADLLDVLYGGARWCRDFATEHEVEPWRVTWRAHSVRVEAPLHEQVQLALKGGKRLCPRVA